MTSRNIFPNRFTKIDELTRHHHSHLSDKDECFFLGEYTATKEYTFSETNSMIFNFKKPLDLKGEAQWKYKDVAIRKSAEAFRNALRLDKLGSLTYIPIPPSKAKTDPLYDDRVIKMLHAICPIQGLDIREIIVQKESTIAVHESVKRPTPNQIEQLYEFQTS